MSHFEKHTAENDWAEGEGSSSNGDHNYNQQHEDEPQGAKAKRHCIKWWWLYSLLLITVVVLIVIPIVFVSIRKSVQAELDKATLTINHLSLQAPGYNGFDFALNATMNSNTDKDRGRLTSFNGSLSILSELDNPFSYFTFPTVDLAPSVPVNFEELGKPVVNMEQLIAFNKLVVQSKRFEFGLSGPAHVKIPGLPKYPVTFTKTIAMTGWNNFTGLSISNIQYYSTPLFDGATVTGKVHLPNPSVIEAQLGNVTMAVYTNGTYLGYSLIQYMDLQPGNNTFDLRGYLNLTAQLAALRDGFIDYEFRGNTSVNFIGAHVPYFEGVLKQISIPLRVNISQAISNSTGTSFSTSPS